MQTELSEAGLTQIEPDWWFVAINQTADWHLEARLMAQVESIRTVYLFDRRRHVRCCELTPSYECWPVSYAVICKETATDLQREEIDVAVNAMLRDEYVCYFHVAHMEQRMASAGVPSVQTDAPASRHFGSERDPFVFHRYGESGVPLSDTNDDREKAADEQRESVMEWYHQREIF